jgi:hypothetical protein
VGSLLIDSSLHWPTNRPKAFRAFGSDGATGGIDEEMKESGSTSVLNSDDPVPSLDASGLESETQ